MSAYDWIAAMVIYSFYAVLCAIAESASKEKRREAQEGVNAEKDPA